MEKTQIDLKDVTFIIPIRLDSIERLENVYYTTNYLLENFDTNIIVLEASEVKSELLPKILCNLIKLCFVQDSDPIFHRTKYLNVMTNLCSSDFIGIWDADVIVSIDQICKAVELLRSKQVNIALPYDGHFLDVPINIRAKYTQNQSFEMLASNADKMNLLYGKRMIGGGIFVNREDYCAAGMENENFYGWGPEDGERVKRWEILDYTIKRVDGALYHLWHPRLFNSRFASQEIKKNNLKELISICSMSKNELMDEISSWEHLKYNNVTVEKVKISNESNVLKLAQNRQEEIHLANIKSAFSIRKNTSDEHVYHSIFIEQEYNFISEKQPKVIIDAGAHIGLASIYFANRYPDCKIISIEPENSNFELLCKNVAPYETIIPVQAALWKTNGKIKLMDPSRGNWGFRVSGIKTDANQIEQLCHEVEAISIGKIMDDYNLDKIDILKVDIEGAEKEVFTECSAWIKSVDAIVIELHEHIITGCNLSFYNGTNGFDFEWKQGENVILSRKGCLSKS